MRWLNARTRNVVLYVLNLSAPASIQEISVAFGVSRRTVYNEIGRANAWLEGCGLPELVIHHGKVVPVSNQEKVTISRRLGEKEENIYILSPQERVWLVVTLVIGRADRVLISDLLEKLEISRTTLLSDLRAVSSFVRSYGLEWTSRGRAGYEVEGDEITRRALYLLLLTMLPDPVKESYLFEEKKGAIEQIYPRLKRIEKALKQEYIESDLYDLAALLSFCGKETITFEDMDRSKIKVSDEYRLVTEQFGKYSEDERIYVTLHFLGARLAGYSNEGIDEADPALRDVTDSFIREFQNTACVEFADVKQLRQALFSHIKASRYRYRYGIQIGCPLEKNIKTEYPEVYRITQETAVYLEQALQVHISEGEIAYLALHFGAFLSLPKKKEDGLRIMIVCVSGISTANMIAREVRRLIPDVRITGIESLRSLVNPHLHADLIISSVDFQALIPVVRVHPVFSDEDRQNILNHPLLAASLRRGNAGALYAKIADLVPKENQERLKQRLNDYFSFGHDRELSGNNTLIHALQNRIDQSHGETDWKNIVQKAAEPLQNSGQITQSYVDMIVELCEEHGPYMFVTEDVVILHARPEDGVNSMCLSLVMTDQPVNLEGREGRFFFLLGPVDQSSHFPWLMEIRNRFKTKEKRQQYLTARTAEELLDMFV